MHIALVTTSLFSQGVEYVVATLARGLAERGHQVDVLVSAVHTRLEQSGKGKVQFPVGESVRLIRMPSKRARYNIFAIRRYIKEESPDVVMCHAAPYYPATAIAQMLLPSARRVCIVYVVHLLMMGFEMATGRLFVPKKSFTGRVYNWLMNKFDAVFTVSEGVRLAVGEVCEVPLEKVWTVYNPAIDQLTDAKLQASPRHPWLQEKTCPVFVAAGAFSEFKNHMMLIEAFAKVRAQEKCRLIIFGDGTLREKYEARIKELGIGDSVSLPGATDNLPAEMRAATAFVLPSVVESFSVVLVEALAAGVPVVSTDAPYGPPEILDNGRYGIMVPRNNVSAMADGLTRALHGERRDVPREVYERFRAERVVAHYEKLLQGLCNKRKGE